MSTKGLRIGHFEADGALINLPIGFIPDYFEMDKVSGGDGALHAVKWYRGMETDEATGSQEGWTDKEGTTDILADAGGITAYDTGSVGPSSGTGAGQLSEWAASTSYTARTATARGSFVKGTVGAANNIGGTNDREAIFECVTGGTSASSEPTWPTAVGGQVLDSTPIWELVVDVPVDRQGYQGITIAAALMSDSDEWYYRAFQSDNGNEDHGDVLGWGSGIDQDWS